MYSDGTGMRCNLCPDGGQIDPLQRFLFSRYLRASVRCTLCASLTKVSRVAYGRHVSLALARRG